MLQCVPALGHFSQRDLRRPLLPCHLPRGWGQWCVAEMAATGPILQPITAEDVRRSLQLCFYQRFMADSRRNVSHSITTILLSRPLDSHPFSLSCCTVINLSASPCISCYSKWFPVPCSLPRTLFSLCSRNHSYRTHMHFLWSLTVWLRSDMLFLTWQELYKFYESI